MVSRDRERAREAKLLRVPFKSAAYQLMKDYPSQPTPPPRDMFPRDQQPPHFESQFSPPVLSSRLLTVLYLSLPSHHVPPR
jgi:hypothetical protein